MVKMDKSQNHNCDEAKKNNHKIKVCDHKNLITKPASQV